MAHVPTHLSPFAHLGDDQDTKPRPGVRVAVAKCQSDRQGQEGLHETTRGTNLQNIYVDPISESISV